MVALFRRTQPLRLRLIIPKILISRFMASASQVLTIAGTRSSPTVTQELFIADGAKTHRSVAPDDVFGNTTDALFNNPLIIYQPSYRPYYVQNIAHCRYIPQAYYSTQAINSFDSRGRGEHNRVKAPWLENCVRQDCDISHSE